MTATMGVALLIPFSFGMDLIPSIGLLLGIVVAYVHNRFCETEFNNAFQIYGGTRFVFIVLIPVMVVLAVLWFALFGVFRYRVRSWVARWVCGGSFEKSKTQFSLEPLSQPAALLSGETVLCTTLSSAPV